MKGISKVFLALAMVLMMASLCFAAPFLVCDPYTGGPGTRPTEFSIILDGGKEIIVPAVPTGATGTEGVRLFYDLAAITIGSHDMNIKAVLVDPAWGRLESAIVPFVFSRPAAAGPPNNIRITPTSSAPSSLISGRPSN